MCSVDKGIIFNSHENRNKIGGFGRMVKKYLQIKNLNYMKR